jgi:hypothetical protein
MPLADLSAEGTMLLLRLTLVGVIYLFLVSVFLVVRGELRRQGQPAAPTPGRLVLLAAGSSSLPQGHAMPLSAVTTLGRAPGSTLLLNDNFVSATHAVMSWRDGQWWLRDAGSTNGTFLNEEPVSEDEVPVSYGDVVGIGRLRLRLAP